ncbi:CHAT domain-containing protein [Siphonobacter sp. SORGH_AS_1065]|uniref:CHAT domain-containing protein n=1 Tax=Siphonobacter sp. SORGH_AS_1065 TaxID=3041795 RepID=UPI00278256D1|nr:CHAT domain-containing protein [Siphonobacter sp. SORGH_AS_1065]MDQ1087677.1 CHAT domain-containing protein [Siphonobacter sp. SORGH_AS_1065]
MSEVASICFRIKLLLVLLISGIGAFGQCPNSAFMHREWFRMKAQASSRIKLEQLRTQWLRCHIPQDSIYSELLGELALQYYLKGNFPATKQFAEAAIQTTKHDVPSLKAKHLYRYGAYLIEMNQGQKAQQILQESIRVSRQSKQLEWAAAASYQLSYLQHSFGDYQSALNSATEGVHFARLAKKLDSELESSYQQAQALMELNRLEEAQVVITSLLEVTRKYPNLLTWAYYKLAAEISRQCQEYSASRAYLQQATELLTPNQTDAQVSIATVAGLLAENEYKFTQARQQYEKALTIAQNPHAKARLYTLLGKLALKQGDYSSALQLINKGIKSIIPSYVENQSTNPIAKVIQSIYRKEYLFTLIKQKASVELLIYKQKPTAQNLAQALATFATADQMVDYMRMSHEATESKLLWRNYTHLLYEQAIEASFLQRNAPLAFYYLEKSRAVLLNDRLNELNANQKLSPQLAEKELYFRAQEEDLLKKLEPETPGSVAYTRLSNQLLNQHEAQQAFIESLRKSNPAYFQYRYDNQVPSITTIQQKLLAKDQAFVSYFLGDDAIYAIGITPDKTVLRKLPLTGFNHEADQFLKLCSSPDLRKKEVQQLQKTGYQLYRRLVTPLRLHSPRMIISLDGAFLPFEAFSNSPTQPNAYLVHQQAFSYTYSARFLLRERPVSSWQKPFLGMAPEQFSASLKQSNLPGSAQSLTDIAESIPFAQTKTHQSATKATFLSEAPDFRILQLFTHADAHVSDHTEPVLYFADSALKLSELNINRPFRTQLLVLSACQTGLGTNQTGEGVFSLARGFAALGIPSTVTTLWSVQDQATYTLVEHFYQQLSEGLPQDIALQRAKVQWLNAQEYQLPYYWAALIQIGSTTPIENPSVIPAYAGIAAGVILVIIGLLMYRKRTATKVPHP